MLTHSDKKTPGKLEKKRKTFGLDLTTIFLFQYSVISKGFQKGPSLGKNEIILSRLEDKVKTENKKIFT